MVLASVLACQKRKEQNGSPHKGFWLAAGLLLGNTQCLRPAVKEKPRMLESPCKSHCVIILSRLLLDVFFVLSTRWRGFCQIITIRSLNFVFKKKVKYCHFIPLNIKEEQYKFSKSPIKVGSSDFAEAALLMFRLQARSLPKKSRTYLSWRQGAFE